MEIIKINKNHPDLLVIKKAIKILRNGGVIVYPTDTAYALGCDSLNKQALARVFKIKKRPAGKAVPFIAGSPAMVKKFCRLDKISRRLVKKYWPGALTLVLPVKSLSNSPFAKWREPILPLSKRGTEGDLAVRVPDCQIARLLSQKLGRPIVSTSANLAGQQVCYAVSDVLRQFGFIVTGLRRKSNPVTIKVTIKPPDLILDAGPLPRRKPSTIVKVIKGKLRIIRQGEIFIVTGLR